MNNIKFGVMHIILSPGGGVWSVIRTLSRWQIKKFPVAIGISYRNQLSNHIIENINELRLEGVKIFTFRVPIEFPNASALFLPPLAKWSKELYKEYDNTRWVFHFHNGPGAGFFFWPSLPFFKTFRQRSLCTFHGIPPEDVVPKLRNRFGWIQTWVNGYLVRYMQRKGISFNTLSHTTKDMISKVYKVRPNAIDVVHNGVVEGKLGCPRLYKKVNDFTIGFVGHLSHGKCWDLVVKAALQLYSQGVNVRCVIAGEGPDINQVKDFAIKYPQIVYYLGSVPLASQNVIPSLDVLILVSMQEGQPMVILEALSCGVPVIATKVGAIPETISHGENGFLLDEPTPNHICNCIRLLIEDIDLHKSMSEQCVTTWKEKFSDNEMGINYLRQYRKILDNEKQ